MFVVPANGGKPVNVTHDTPTDWAPVWAPDGKSLYFSSDRGGTMSVWRIAVDEASGKPDGVPTPVIAGVDIDMDSPHIATDASALIFRSVMKSVNPASMSFDQNSARAGMPELLQRRTGLLTPASISPDGQWLTLVNAPDRHQDVWVMRVDGSQLTRLTDDDARDWYPRFTPDGQAITFYSNQSGRYEGWSIRPDGSARTKLTNLSKGTFAPLISPDGHDLYVSTFSSFENARILKGPLPGPVTDATATPLKGITIEGDILQLSTMSPDGRWLVGAIGMASGENVGLAIYDIAAARMKKLTNDSFNGEAAWMPDGRHVLYFTTHGALIMQDIETLERRVVASSLMYPPDMTQDLVASPDGHRLFYGAQQIQSNIWMVRKP